MEMMEIPDIDGVKKGQARQRYSAAEVVEELEKRRTGKGSLGKNAAVLLVTLVLFFYLGFFRQGFKGVVLLIAVLLVHEAGHLAAMKLFGYKNVQMFFIPLFGAAVSGRSRNAAAWRKATVSLAGPLPGILIGIWCLVIYWLTKTEVFKQAAIIFIFLNAFNLLPFYPLDGGRVLHEILFSRNRYVEMVFRVLAAMALIGAGLLMQAWLLAIFGFVCLVAVGSAFKLSGISREIRERLSQEDAIEGGSESDDESIPVEIAEEIVEKIQERIKTKLNLKTITTFTETVWEGIDTRPPGALATTGLLGIYLIALFLPVAALIGSAVFSAANEGGLYSREIVQYEREDGQTGWKEQIYTFGQLYSEAGLSEDKTVYHGDGVIYFWDGNIFKEGKWYDGRPDGEWKEYNMEGDVANITVYDKGRFVSRKEREGEEWKDVSWEELPADLKDSINKALEEPAKGPG